MTRKITNEELKRISPEEFREVEKIPVTVVLDNIRSMHNVGAVFRSSDAFLIEKIILAGITARPPHRDIHKSALGATETVAWEYHKNVQEIISTLKNDGYTIAAVEQARPSVSLDVFEPVAGEKYVLVFGNEVFGVQDEIVAQADFCIEIPQSGTKHSLNISVSAGIVLWHMYKKLHVQPD